MVVLVTLFALHMLGAAGVVALGHLRRPRLRTVASALPPTVTAVLAGWLLAVGGAPVRSEWTWVPGLDLDLVLMLDELALLLTVLISGIGALVLVYTHGYLGDRAPGAERLGATLLLFSASMLVLVWAESVWTLFIAWELTSVTSFLLVGHSTTNPTALAAARRALMVTGGGGLALLVGLLLLADGAGSALLSRMVPIDGGQGAVAALLILVGVATKSAQVPFHAWLPGAMAAPTPVSAYLHSATMVKAGIILHALLGPSLAEVRVWADVGLALGAMSMIWGAIVALRQIDGKLILAWGTISQLGFLLVLLSSESDKATFAALSVLVAHAVFKAALFLIVGEVDIRTGTRRIDELGGLARSMPLAASVAGVAALSMAGVAPMLGFAAKEAALEAALAREGTRGALVGAIVIGGSVLTVAYTLRFWWGVFGPGPTTSVSPMRSTMSVPSAVLAAITLAAGVSPGWVGALVRRSMASLSVEVGYELYLWPGFTTAFVTSMMIVACGSVLAVVAVRVRLPEPGRLGADGIDGALDGVLNGGRWLTALVQHGSLPMYLVTMTAVAALAGASLASAGIAQGLIWWDTPVQAILVLAVLVASGGAVLVPSRLGAALALGAVGVGMTGIFVVHGAPDLAVTQLLVETVIVVGFVLGMGTLRRRFPTGATSWRAVRVVVAGASAAIVMAGLAVSAGGPVVAPPVEEIVAGAVAEGGGSNIVNVVLTDLRALDTLGEVIVLAAVAIGVLALARPTPGLAARSGASATPIAQRSPSHVAPPGTHLQEDPTS